MLWNINELHFIADCWLVYDYHMEYRTTNIEHCVWFMYCWLLNWVYGELKRKKRKWDHKSLEVKLCNISKSSSFLVRHFFCCSCLQRFSLIAVTPNFILWCYEVLSITKIVFNLFSIIVYRNNITNDAFSSSQNFQYINVRYPMKITALLVVAVAK